MQEAIPSGFGHVTFCLWENGFNRLMEILFLGYKSVTLKHQILLTTSLSTYLVLFSQATKVQHVNKIG